MNPEVALAMVPREGANATVVFMIQMVAIFAIFYFLLIRPQAKERRRHEERLRAVGKGDEVVTQGGIIGTVVHAEEDRLTIRTGDNTRITVARSRIAEVLSDREDEGSARGARRRGRGGATED